MFASLKASAQDAAAKAQQAAKQAYEAGKERVEIGMAGKALLDNGGEEMKTKLLAKKASRDLASVDAAIMRDLAKVVADYQIASNRLLSVAAAQPAASEAQNFNLLGKAYEARAIELSSGTKLQREPGVASISPAESDAISILTAKSSATGFGDKIRSSVKGSSSNSTGEGYSSEKPQLAPSDEPRKSMLEKAQDKAKNVADQAKQRYDTANSGKKMVDEGGDDVAERLLAKKASIDTVAFDKKIVDRLREAIADYREAENLTRQSLPSATGESPSFTDLEQYFKARGSELELFLSALSPVPSAIDASPDEKDAIVYLTAKLDIKSATDSVTSKAADVQGKVVEKALGSAVSSATGGAVKEVPEGTGKAAVKYAKENPEQAKAAMQFAANVAKK